MIKNCKISLLDKNFNHIWLVTPETSKQTVEGVLSGVNLNELLAEKKCLLFRGFNVDSDKNFSQIVSSLAEQQLTYKERSTQRIQTAKGVYTSTEYPANKLIANHSENAFQNVIPGKILFCSLVVADVGGETPISDNRKILKILPPEVIAKFREHGVIYQRNFDGGFDLSWQEAFQTESQSEVQQYCYDNKIEFEWISENHLRTRQKRHAIIQHPITGEDVWFNQLHLFHVTNLEPTIQQALLLSLGTDLLPRHAFYGNGEEIPNHVVDEIRTAFVQSEVVFKWQVGDFLIGDNMLISHGRKPFEGPRAVRVALIDPVTL
ncbi:TauD/TfdA family dioxygenase [Vibrio sp. MEBiC08052]|uniref:TauD/TfdA family dioxygenase n=1 Tax=Vibrio sp. MEBiC08052 TaxID=1761910 RepID=UPI0007405ED3|nr:TauD/TfdA family dioxygenase [Vibrio sp. MEBiC08052]KUI97644.1 taurine catabolism dioxygenase TauD/TfdA [Vibrio sp. MEBiC08052]